MLQEFLKTLSKKLIMSICKIKCEKMKKLFNCANYFYGKAVYFLENYLSSILLITIRIWIAAIFFNSGLTKISNIETTIMLFEYEYDLPIISPIIAAYLATATEIGFSVLIAFGILTRFSSLAFIFMTLIIQFFVFENAEHFYWLFLLSTLFIFGAGKISIDYLTPKFLCKSNK
jgi:putative oxidoreductase